MTMTIKRWASRLLLLLLVACMAVPTAVAETAVAAPKPTSVTLDQTGTIKLAIGDTLTLNATLYPEGAVSSLKWKSSKKKIASVKGGVVTPKKVGTTTITVTTKNKKKARVKIKVIDPYKPSKVTLDKVGKQTMLMGEGMQLTATLFPETAKSKLKWRSSNKRVAVVGPTGWVGAVSTGKATITVTTRNKKKAKVKIKVIDNGNVPIWTPDDYDKPYLVYICKKSHTIAILARDGNGGWTRVLRKFSTGLGRGNVTNVGFFRLHKKERWHKWGSGYSPFACKLDVGVYIHGPIYKAMNQHTIRPSYYNCIGTDCSSGCVRTTCGAASWIYYNCAPGTLVFIAPNKRFTCPRPKKIGKKATKDPTDPGDHPEILVSSFKLEPGEVTLEKGGTQQLSISDVYPTNASNKTFTFKSLDTKVATVSDAGVVTAVGAGTAVIQAIANDDYKFCMTTTVNVTGAAAESAKLTEAAPVEAPEEVLVLDNAQASEDGALTILEAPVEVATAEEATAEAADAAVPAGDEIIEAKMPAEDEVADEATADEVADAPEDEVAPQEDVAPAAVEEIPVESVEPDPALNADENGLSFVTEEVPEAESDIIIDQDTTNE